MRVRDWRRARLRSARGLVAEPMQQLFAAALLAVGVFAQGRAERLAEARTPIPLTSGASTTLSVCAGTSRLYFGIGLAVQPNHSAVPRAAKGSSLALRSCSSVDGRLLRFFVWQFAHVRLVIDDQDRGL